MISSSLDDRPARPIQADPTMALYYDNTNSLRQAEIDYLVKRHNVPTMALCYDGDRGGEMIASASVVFVDSYTALFDFAAEAHDDGIVRALIFVARDRCGELNDLIAWAPKSGKIASHYGRAAILGEHQVNAFRLGGPLVVHRRPLEWLQAGRIGIVIVDPKRAWRALEGVPVVAEDVDHGLLLDKVLVPPKAQILVRNAQHQEAA